MIKAIIFDMDGVISNSMSIHQKATSIVLKKFGKVYSDEMLIKNAGRPIKDILEEMLKGEDANIDELVKEKTRITLELGENNIFPVDGIYELLDRVSSFKLAVGSGATREFIIEVLDELRIKDKFEVISSAYDCARGKPAPDVFMKAAEGLGLDYNECVVIEDGVAGMIAAKSAGMKCIGFVKSLDEICPADKLVLSLNDITKELIENL